MQEAYGNQEAEFQHQLNVVRLIRWPVRAMVRNKFTRPISVPDIIMSGPEVISHLYCVHLMYWYWN